MSLKRVRALSSHWFRCKGYLKINEGHALDSGNNIDCSLVQTDVSADGFSMGIPHQLK